MVEADIYTMISGYKISLHEIIPISLLVGLFHIPVFAFHAQLLSDAHTYLCYMHVCIYVCQSMYVATCAYTQNNNLHIYGYFMHL